MAKRLLGWQPRVSFRQLVEMMVDADLAHRLARHLRPALLVLDDFGLKPLRPPGPEDLYDIIHERYERASTLLTSNRDRSEWADLFGEPLLASAALDQLTRRAHFVEITGASYRPGRPSARRLAGSLGTGGRLPGSTAPCVRLLPWLYAVPLEFFFAITRSLCQGFPQYTWH